VPEWLALLEAADVAVRKLAMEKVGDRDSAEVADALLRQLNHPDRSLRDGALARLTRLKQGQKALTGTLLEADSADALVKWLASNAYMFSPELKAWAKPYVESGWKITALKVAKPADAKEKKSVTASSLRITFKTDRPVFPYREPNPEKAATDLGAHDRLLRIYFLADARYAGSLDGRPWTGKVAWAGPIKDEDRAKTLEHLNLPSTTGPAKWWLTEFEEHWPYQSAPADVYFSRSGDQSTVVRPPIIQYIWSPWTADGMIYALAAVVVGPPLLRRLRRDKKR